VDSIKLVQQLNKMNIRYAESFLEMKLNRIVNKDVQSNEKMHIVGVRS